MPGYDVRVVDDALQGGAARHDRLDRHQAAAAAVVPADAVAGRTSASAESYLEEFPGYYKTADAGFIDDDGYVYVMGRTDDIINVAGHRLSTGGMEQVLAVAPATSPNARCSASRTS